MRFSVGESDTHRRSGLAELSRENTCDIDVAV